MGDPARMPYDPNPPISGWTMDALDLVAMECAAQDAKWGADRDIPDGTGRNPEDQRRRADLYRRLCQQAFAADVGTWRDILLEEVYEAMAESDPQALRRELIQVAAVASQWAANIERRVSAHG